MSLLRWLFANPTIAPHTQVPALRSRDQAEMMGYVGLRDFAPRIAPGYSATFPRRRPKPGTKGFQPYITIYVSERHPQMEISLNDYKNGIQLRAVMIQDETTGLVHIDRLSVNNPVDKVNGDISCALGNPELMEALNIFRTAVTRIRHGGLDNLDGTAREMARFVTPAQTAAPRPR